MLTIMQVTAFARLADKAARWPIQTVVLVSLLVTGVYVAMLDLSVNSFLSPLSRTYLISGPDAWAPTTNFDAKAPRFVGAPLQFASVGASETAVDYVLSLLPEQAVVDEGSILVRPSEYLAWAAKVRSFAVDNGDSVEKWRLRDTYSWVVWVKWCFHHLQDLVGATPIFDLGIVGIAYIAMYYVFFSTWRQARALGSRGFMFVSALISSTFSFMIAYVTVSQAGISVPMRVLLQGVPFFVVVVGFDTKVSFYRECVRVLRKQPEMSPAVIVTSVLNTRGVKLLRDNLIEIAFLSVAVVFRLPDLWEFCAMCALLLVVDVFMLSTFYAALLSIKLSMMRVERNDAIRRALEEDGVSEKAAEQYADAALGTHFSAAAESPILPSWKSSLFKTAFLIAAVLANWLEIYSFPISLWIDSADLREPDVNVFASHILRKDEPALLTLIPALKFVRAQDEGFIHRLWALCREDSSILRSLVAGLALSLVLNGYLLRLIRKQAAVVKVVEKRVPVIVERQQSSEKLSIVTPLETPSAESLPMRSMDDSIALLKAGMANDLTNEELVDLGLSGKLPLYALEKQLGDATRAVVVRRSVVSRLSNTKTLEASKLPWQSYDYDRVLGACCENVIGYMPLPVGVAGPILIDGKEFFLPLATTEGVLVASTMRGCKAINGGGGVTTEILQDGMTRGPCVTFDSLRQAASAKRWLDSEEGLRAMRKAFESTSRFAKLASIKTALAGTLLFIRFRARTGDAMGMNMISKGVERALQAMAEEHGYEDMSVVSVSGNYCTDKKASALNWIDGRGKSVVAEATVPAALVQKVLKTTVDDLVELNTSKNLIGSAMAGVVGGYNAHAANLVAAIFLATGQDPAQVVEGSNCMTLMANVDGNLQISVTMPSLEVGTIGGGTILEPQAAMLDMLGVKGPHAENPGENARQLARVVASGVLAGELSLCSALAAGHLVKSHMAHNRKAPAK